GQGCARRRRSRAFAGHRDAARRSLCRLMGLRRASVEGEGEPHRGDPLHGTAFELSLMFIPPPFIRHFSALAPRYDVVLCDVWGVVHNGARATIESCDALARYRQQGGTVILITNAPRPGDVVRE